MRNLWEFLAKNNHWFVFVVLEVISLMLLFQYNSYQGSVWFSSANAVAGKVYELYSKAGAFMSLTKVNEELTQRNIALEQQVGKLSGQLAELTKADPAAQVRKLDSTARYTLIPAKVVGNSLDKRDNLITIDKGSVDGVGKDMGVVCGNGLVGIVYMVSEHYSVVIPVLNSQSNISCAIKGRGYFGFLQWNGGVTDEANVNGIPRHAHFKRGDEIVTNGYSSIFPYGILIGRVLRVYNSDDGLSYRLRVKLSTDFGRLRDVCVMYDPKAAGRRYLLQVAQDSLRQREN